MMSQNIGKIAIALSKVQGTVGLIPKSKTATVPMKSGGQFKYSYADLANIWEAIRKSLMENEIAVTQLFSMQENRGYMTTILMHSSGEWIKSVLEIGSHEKIQELGSEITYLRRYGLSSILGIAADEDEDGQAANTSKRTLAKEPIAILSKETRKITDKQEAFLDSLVLQVELIDESYIAKVKEHLGVKSIYDVDAQQCDVAIKSFQKRIKAHKEESDESASVA